MLPPPRAEPGGGVTASTCGGRGGLFVYFVVALAALVPAGVVTVTSSVPTAPGGLCRKSSVSLEGGVKQIPGPPPPPIVRPNRVALPPTPPVGTRRFPPSLVEGKVGAATSGPAHGETAVVPKFTPVAPLNPLPKIRTFVPPLAVPWLGPTAFTTGATGATYVNLVAAEVALGTPPLVTEMSTVVFAVPGGLRTNRFESSPKGRQRLPGPPPGSGCCNPEATSARCWMRVGASNFTPPPGEISGLKLPPPLAGEGRV